MTLPAKGRSEKFALFILKTIWNFMGEISSFWNLTLLGTCVALKSVSVKKLILCCRRVLGDAVNNSQAVRYLELQFRTTDDEDQHVQVMILKNARGKQGTHKR